MTGRIHHMSCVASPAWAQECAYPARLRTVWLRHRPRVSIAARAPLLQMRQPSKVGTSFVPTLPGYLPIL